MAHTRSNLKVKRHHGYSVVLFILGTLFPPLAVAARFGIGSDFWLNLLLTICGYIPGHVHNFYIQNVRNNKNHRRTPKWAQQYGLVNTDKIERNKKRSEWAGRYEERLPHSTLEDAPLAEGQETHPPSVADTTGSVKKRTTTTNSELWNPEDEHFYGRDNDSANSSGSGGRWHYPANFEDTMPANGDAPKKKKKKKEKKDRWARTEDAYSLPEEQSARKKSKKKRRSSAVESRDDSVTNFPEDPEGGLYGERRAPEATNGGPAPATGDENIFSHEF